MILSELERALLARYPKADAEGWDHVGLSVGDPAAEITSVACALDATEDNVHRALEAGANVLLTHHPIYIKAPEATGLGALATLNDPCTLRDLAARAATAFGSDPRVWGEAEHACRTVAILGGSLGDFGELAIAAGADVIVTGEAGYHVAQDLALRGLPVILLGHDRSEEPFIDILMNSAVDAGVDPRHAIKILNPCQWWTVTKGENL